MSRTYKSEGIVLKRRNIGEADKLITTFTKHHGKVVGIAKGIRKISSRRAGSLEPATQAIIFFSKGKSFDIITQVKLINSFSQSKKNLARLTQVNQILEIIDLLTSEQQSHPLVYDVLLNTLNSLNAPGAKKNTLITNIKTIVQSLGFGLPQDDSELALKHHLESITDRKLRSKKFLTS